MSTESIAERIGVALSAALRDTGWSQRLLANRIGVPQGTVSLWKHGQRVPSIAHAIRVDLAFGWEPGDLLKKAGIIKPTRLEDVLEDDPAVDDVGVGDMLAKHDEVVLATARRRSRSSTVAPVPARGLVPAGTIEELSAQLLDVSRSLAPLGEQAKIDIIRATVSVLLGFVTLASGNDSDLATEITALPALEILGQQNAALASTP